MKKAVVMIESRQLACSKCGKTFTRTDSQIKKRDLVCLPCRYERDYPRSKRRFTKRCVTLPDGRRVCSKCGVPFIPTNHQIKKHDFVCVPCARQVKNAWRHRRTALGIPAQDLEKKVKWEAQEDVKARRKTLHAARQKRYRKTRDTRFKELARRSARDAIKRGRIVAQPCEVCGNPNTEAHHDDYHKRWEVRWLCGAHHRELHGKISPLVCQLKTSPLEDTEEEK